MTSTHGTLGYTFSRMVRDTIAEHGLQWAVRYYVKRHKIPARQFRIFAGI